MFVIFQTIMSLILELIMMTGQYQVTILALLQKVLLMFHHVLPHLLLEDSHNSLFIGQPEFVTLWVVTPQYQLKKGVW